MSDTDQKNVSKDSTQDGARGSAPKAVVNRPRPVPAGHPLAGGAPVVKASDLRASLRRIAGLLRPERARIATVAVLGIVGVVLAVIGPRVLGYATDLIFAGVLGRRLSGSLDGTLPDGASATEAARALRAGGEGQLADLVSGADVVVGRGIDFGRLTWVLLAVVGLYLASSVFTYLQGVVATGVVQRTVHRLRADAAAKITRLPLSYFDRQPRGEVLSRVTNDIDNLAQTLQQSLSQLVTSVLTVVGVLGIMFWISPVLALVALISVPLSAVVTAVIARRSQPQFGEQWRATGALNAHVEEMITGHAIVTAFGREQAAAEVFAQENEKLYLAGWRAQAVSGTTQPAMTFLANLTYVLIAVLGGLRVANGTMTIGDVQAFVQYSRQFSQPITTIASMMNVLQSGAASAERVFELLDTPEQDPDPAEPERIPGSVRGRAQGRVVFEDVAFRYDPAEPLIEGLSLVAEPGQTVAIVGPTGAGKTTLVNLLLRFYEVGSGRITLDEVDTRAMTRDDLRAQIGMVLQDTWLFGGTIAQNIAYGRPDATHEEVLAAARATYVDRFVHSLPEGYDTRIDEEGSNVSAGEKQLITIARAFLADPAILVLDEATSSVDTRTEVLVQHAMAQLREGRTSFVIAHRLSTIRDADTILVMRDGSIVEQGDHRALLAQDGAYAQLYRSQFAAPVEGTAP